MNIAASNAQGNAAPSRMEAATANDPVVDGDAAGSDAVQGFGQVLSATVSRETPQPTRGDAKDGRTVDAPAVATSPAPVNDDVGGAAASGDRPIALDLNAILGGQIDAPKGVATDATTRSKSTDASKDLTEDPATGDVSAQLAMLSQWTGPTPLIAKAAASVEDGADPAVASRALPSLAAVPRSVGTVPSAGSRSMTAAIGPAVVAAVDPTLVPEAVAPAALDVATFVAGRTALPLDPPVVMKTGPSKPDGPTRVASPDSITAAFEKVLGVTVAGTTSNQDPGSIAGQFVAQVAANVANAQGSLASVATASSAALREPVATPAWSHELGQAAIRMATDDLQHASLRLNPEHLGPLDVQMRIDNGIAHLQFTAAHADTRAALEGSRATLDQMFGDQGLKLGDWSVGNSSTNASFARQFGGASAQGDDRRASTEDGDAPEVGATVTMRTTRQLGLVDTFA